MKSLATMAEEVASVNRANGWFDTSRTFGEELMLIVSEAGEALDAWRESSWLSRTAPDGKPADTPSELADILIRLLDTTWRHGVDLEAEYERKLAYNRTRPYRHGGKAL